MNYEIIDYNPSILYGNIMPSYAQWTTEGGTKEDVSRMDTDDIYKYMKSIYNKDVQFESESQSEGWLNAFSHELGKRHVYEIIKKS